LQEGLRAGGGEPFSIDRREGRARPNFQSYALQNSPIARVGSEIIRDCIEMSDHEKA
jgi:hypothetical protein